MENEQNESESLSLETSTPLTKEEIRKLNKDISRIEIEQSNSYQSIATIKKWMDEYYLDGIIGLIPFGVGDIFTKLFSLPFVYVSLFKVRSIALVLAVLFNMLLDILLGILPFPFGAVIDFFYRSYNSNFELIVGFVEDDRDVIKKINEKAIWMAVGIVFISYLIYLFISFINWASNTVSDWFNSIFSFF